MEARSRHAPVVVCYLCLLFFGNHFVRARISFEKDQSMHFEFPPRIERAIDDKMPQGHLRPLGFQRHTDGPINKLVGMPSPEVFYKYIHNNKPVLMAGAIANVTVEKTWEKDEYLKEKYGNINVTVIARIDYDTTGRRKKVLMRFKKFLLDYLYEDWYISTTIPIEMANELTIPQCLSCGSYFERLQEAELWISSGPTSTDLHSHENHILHCLLFGRRDFTIVQSKFKSHFEFKHDYPTSDAGHSTLNINRINMFKYEDIANVPWKYASIKKGDCIFIPAEYLHQVRSYGRAISYTITFAPALHFDLKGCHGDEVKKTFRLKDANFVWTYLDGHLQLVNTRFSAESLRKTLYHLLGGKEKLTYHKFNNFYEQALKLIMFQPWKQQHNYRRQWRAKLFGKAIPPLWYQPTNATPYVLHHARMTPSEDPSPQKSPQPLVEKGIDHSMKSIFESYEPLKGKRVIQHFMDTERLPSLDVFHRMASKHRDFMSRKDIEKLTEDQLESAAKVFNMQHLKKLEL